MAKITGLTRYICDRCADNEIVERGESAETWKDIKRFDANGKQQDYLLCGLCAASHDTYMQAEDTSFAEWMASWESEREAEDGGEG